MKNNLLSTIPARKTDGITTGLTARGTEAPGNVQPQIDAFPGAGYHTVNHPIFNWNCVQEHRCDVFG